MQTTRSTMSRPDRAEGPMANETFGRSAELKTIESLLDTVNAGPCAVVIHGDAGIGKTTVWSEALKEASDHGLQVLSCRPAKSEARLSFSGLTDLLGEHLDDVIAHLPAPQGRALQVALLRA